MRVLHVLLDVHITCGVRSLLSWYDYERNMRVLYLLIARTLSYVMTLPMNVVVGMNRSSLNHLFDSSGSGACATYEAFHHAVENSSILNRSDDHVREAAPLI